MTYRLNVSFPYFSGLPSDVVVNTFHFNWNGGGTPTNAQFLNLVDLLEAFYATIFDDIPTASMAPWIDLGAVNVKAYNLADPEPRVPVYEITTTFGATQATNSTIPPEVSLCLSYQAAAVSGQSQARRRGRLFIGGIGVGVTAGDSDSFPVPTTDIINNMSSAARTLMIDAPDFDWTWVVWSRMNVSAAVVTNGWIDNAFDTQRRRGNGPSARTAWVA